MLPNQTIIGNMKEDKKSLEQPGTKIPGKNNVIFFKLISRVNFPFAIILY